MKFINLLFFNISILCGSISLASTPQSQHLLDAMQEITAENVDLKTQLFESECKKEELQGLLHLALRELKKKNKELNQKKELIKKLQKENRDLAKVAYWSQKKK